MQNKGVIDIVTNKNQGKPDTKYSFYLGFSLRKKQLKHSELVVNSLIIKKQNPNKRQSGQE